MKCKKLFDARTLSHDALEQLRISAVKRVQAGESPETVASGMGINRRTIYRWLFAHKAHGYEGLHAKPVPGPQGRLNRRQLQRLEKIIREKNPQQMKFEYALWTLRMIQTLIHQEFGVNLSVSSVRRLVRNMGFTPQRPLYRAWQQDPEKVAQWLREDYPKILKQAKRANALIFFADESGVRSDYHAGTTWAKKGKTPVVKVTGARYGFNMISAVSAGGQFRFMLVSGSVNAHVFRKFLQRLIQGSDRKIFLIVDAHPTHKARIVKQFLAEHKEHIELFFLPPYSPELNPDELAWAHIKHRLGRVSTQTKDDLLKTTASALRSLQRLPDTVAAFFRVPTCRYALL